MTSSASPSGPARPGDRAALLDERLAEVLARLASDAPAPGGGAAAALAVALGASLCAMTARRSDRQLPDAAALTTRAEALLAVVAPLAEADGEAYGPVLAARRAARDPSAGPDAGRRLEEALAAAADVPLAVAEAAAAVAELGALLAASGNPNLRGDAVVAVLLSESAARAARALVEIDLAGMPGDPRRRRCDAACGQAAVAVARLGRPEPA